MKRACIMCLVGLVCLSFAHSMAVAEPGTVVPAPAAAEAATDELPSIAEGQPAGIQVGQYAPDFALEPIEVHADFRRWLGDEAPLTAQGKVMLSAFAHKAPIVLLFGSYT